MARIICLSTTNWYPVPTRKQQVMGRMKGHRVLYFEPPVSRAAPLKDPRTLARMLAFRQEGDPVSDALTVYATPPVWPMYNKYRRINRLNQRVQARYIRKVMASHGFFDVVLWCYSPVAADLLDLVPHKALVYDCVDRHSAYGGLMTPEVVDQMERDLAARADVVFATARGLYDTLRPLNENTYLVPNGANFELFNQAAGDGLTFPDDMFNIQNPVFGFVGMLQPCVDLDLVLYAADARPDWSFVFIGEPLPDVDVTPLRQRPNIHLLGLKPHKELPRYLARFDVCLNLFRAGDLSRDVSPLKFYEYLATGKPIVSTPQPEQVNDYADAVYIAGDPEDFLAACEKALAERNPWMTRQRIHYGRESSWDARVAQMVAILKEKGVL
ncbi:MAG: glycosyltransferase [Oscillospiraceae bacterium]|jgi:glycosyltransferase involved in cell wall biosynthesis|nr:glycosyltransferase [Oscillospiraceae bacterium]